jgi:DNA repair photolyase
VRWQGLSVDQDRERRLPRLTGDAVIRTFDAPEALGIRFHEIRAKSALNRVPERSRMPFRWTVNPYRGCTHACVYCFARTTHTYLDLDAGRDFEREIVVKVNAPELLKAELSRPSWKQEIVALGTNTDPYQWVESRYRLMPGIWEAIRDSATPSSLVTKSPLVLRDLSLLQEINERSEMTVYLSVPTLDEKAWRATEPHTPSPAARLNAVRELNRAGIPAGVLVAPLMPGINDSPEQVERILALAREAGAISAAGVTLHLRGEVKEVFFGWLRQHRPDLVPRYEELYAKGAYAPSEVRKQIEARARLRGRRRRVERGKRATAPEQPSEHQPALF